MGYYSHNYLLCVCYISYRDEFRTYICIWKKKPTNRAHERDFTTFLPEHDHNVSDRFNLVVGVTLWFWKTDLRFERRITYKRNKSIVRTFLLLLFLSPYLTQRSRRFVGIRRFFYDVGLRVNYEKIIISCLSCVVL